MRENESSKDGMEINDNEDTKIYVSKEELMEMKKFPVLQPLLCRCIHNCFSLYVNWSKEICFPFQTDRDEREILLFNSQNGFNQRTLNFIKDFMANLNGTVIKVHIWSVISYNERITKEILSSTNDISNLYLWDITSVHKTHLSELTILN